MEIDLVQGNSADMANMQYLFLQQSVVVARVSWIGEIRRCRPSHACLDHGMNISVVQGQQ